MAVGRHSTNATSFITAIYVVFVSWFIVNMFYHRHSNERNEVKTGEKNWTIALLNQRISFSFCAIRSRAGHNLLPWSRDVDGSSQCSLQIKFYPYIHRTAIPHVIPISMDFGFKLFVWLGMPLQTVNFGKTFVPKSMKYRVGHGKAIFFELRSTSASGLNTGRNTCIHFAVYLAQCSRQEANNVENAVWARTSGTSIRCECMA